MRPSGTDPSLEQIPGALQAKVRLRKVLHVERESSSSMPIAEMKARTLETPNASVNIKTLPRERTKSGKDIYNMGM